VSKRQSKASKPDPPPHLAGRGAKAATLGTVRAADADAALPAAVTELDVRARPDRHRIMVRPTG
jgi:hypothetical protein